MPPMHEELKRHVQALNARLDRLSGDQLNRLEKYVANLEHEALQECFVMMPFGDSHPDRPKAYWTEFFNAFLAPALFRCGYNARRSEGGPNNIVRGIMEDLAWTERGLAVVTDRNPNVWYELGVRHSFQKGATLMVCQQDQVGALPFDLRDHGVVGYSPTLDLEPFVQKLRCHIDRLDNRIIDSPIAEFSHSGLAYCIHRALAGLRALKKSIEGRIEGEIKPIIAALNEKWRAEDLQITIVKHDNIFVHRGEVAEGAPAARSWCDAAADGASRYPMMKEQGHGLWVGAIVRMPGRLTACAYETFAEREWVAIVEAHISQADF